MNDTTYDTHLYETYCKSYIIYNNNNLYCNLRPRAHVHITFYVHVQVDI